MEYFVLFLLLFVAYAARRDTGSVESGPGGIHEHGYYSLSLKSGDSLDNV